MTESYDVAILGAGTAGLSALREVRKHTERFVIINGGPYGTTCARVGCMPSKALIEAANAFARRKAFPDFGIRGGEQLTVDIPAVLERVRRLRDQFVGGAVRLTSVLGERSIAGTAQFLSPDTLQVGERTLRAKSIVIATGSSPFVPEAWPQLGARLITTDSLFELHDLPARIAVVGLGPIGVELSQALARLGIRVSAFGDDAAIAGLTDSEVNEHALAILRSDVQVHVGPRVTVQLENDGVRITSGEHTEVFDAVFAAMGRRPNVAGLHLDRLGVPLDSRGLPRVDGHSMQIDPLRVFMAGDVDGTNPIQHEGNDEGHIAGFNAVRAPLKSFCRRVRLGIVFSDPQIAFVGKPRRDLDDAQTVIGTADFSRQGRAIVAAANRGLLRVYVDQKTQRLLGAEMCTPHAEHFAHLLALAIERSSTVAEILRMPFYHPTLEEGLRTALRDAAGQLGVRAQSDLASCGPVGAAALD
ncbi:MAG: dihydrolipoyl dehydrogenase [Pseudomonadota bacterium]|nr:dihydrolipoyl dehydrogenase [Pseudomonadota bacterium]